MRAIEDFTEAVGIYPPEMKSFLHGAYLFRAMAYRKIGLFDISISDYNKVIEIASGSTTIARDLRGEVYLDKHEYDIAISEFSQVISEDPTWFSPYLSRSRAYLGKGDLDKSISDAAIVIRMWPDYFEGYMRRGIARAVKGEYALAAGDLTEAINRDPTDIFSHHFRAYVFDKQGRPDLAIEDLKTILTLQAETEAEKDMKTLAQERVRKLQSGL